MGKTMGFFGMLHSIYNMLGTLASAFGRGAQALDNLGAWAEEQTATFVDEARIERQTKIEQLMAKRKAGTQLLNATSATEVMAKEEVKA